MGGARWQTVEEDDAPAAGDDGGRPRGDFMTSTCSVFGGEPRGCLLRCGGSARWTACCQWGCWLARASSPSQARLSSPGCWLARARMSEWSLSCLRAGNEGVGGKVDARTPHNRLKRCVPYESVVLRQGRQRTAGVGWCRSSRCGPGRCTCSCMPSSDRSFFNSAAEHFFLLCSGRPENIS